MARLEVNGELVPDGAVATVVSVFDFDYPYMYELENGGRTRGGGRGWTIESAEEELDRGLAAAELRAGTQ
jgi:hypothetical protein